MTTINRLRNILVNAAKPGYLPVMIDKLRARLIDRGSAPRAACLAWCAEQAGDAAAWAKSIDAALWAEAEEFGTDHRVYAELRLREIGLDLGGGGEYAMLYFLTRHIRPAAVLETGVAAGHSSRAILAALRANGGGTLYSSDFPYFRIDNPERYVGILVENELRTDWVLRIKGDAMNLPELLAAAPPIDLFHYDSDKTVSGRRRAYGLVRPHLTDRAVVVFDDIQDNWHFRDVAAEHAGTALVFAFQGKYLGVLLPPGFA